MAFEGSIYLWELVRSAARMPCGQHFRCHSAGSIPIEELRKSETTPAMRSERERERDPRKRRTDSKTAGFDLDDNSCVVRNRVPRA